MNTSYLNNFLLVCKIVLPTIVCITLLNLKDVFFGLQFVLIFGFIIITFNNKKLKNHFIGSLLLSFILSFLVLFLSMVVGTGINYFITEIIGVGAKADISISNMEVNDLPSLISIAIISPLLMFYCYQILFTIRKTNYLNYVKWISIIILVSLGFTNILSSKDNSIPISWQLIMILALQLILYQDELKSMFSSKKSI
ncbi:MAG: hypothetical protein ACJAZK_000017 [Psychroserpens sp.]|jgi:hypothetical protein|uniref:hypothetical protein n=1 Tax=Psychroserpens sp. TaxID=2020870 RepID=UPI0039E72447